MLPKGGETTSFMYTSAQYITGSYFLFLLLLYQKPVVHIVSIFSFLVYFSFVLLSHILPFMVFCFCHSLSMNTPSHRHGNIIHCVARVGFQGPVWLLQQFSCSKSLSIFLQQWQRVKRQSLNDYHCSCQHPLMSKSNSIFF